MKVEDAEWKPLMGRGRRPMESTKALRTLQVGDVKRVIHDDVVCNICLPNTPSPGCTLSQEIKRLRETGWELDYYHEQAHVLVIRRLK